jgi:hypothetical protein
MLVREQWRLRTAREDAMDGLLAALAGFGAVWLAVLVAAGLAAALVSRPRGAPPLEVGSRQRRSSGSQSP